MIKHIGNITKKQIATEWDLVADKREQLIQSNSDISLLYVTEPFVAKCLNLIPGKNVLDCGCGSGHLSALIAKFDRNVTAIDISGKSINIAEKKYNHIKNIRFYRHSIEDHSKLGFRYDLCISNMVFMDVFNIEEVMSSIYNILNENGYLCFSITHPCFWPIYAGYFDSEWFKYNSEICISAPLIINKRTIGTTTHFHRPLEQYISLCQSAGFKIELIEELYPYSINDDVNYKYEYPRFLGIVCQKKQERSIKRNQIENRHRV